MLGMAAIVAALSLAAGPPAPMVGQSPAKAWSSQAAGTEGLQLLYDDPVADPPEAPRNARSNEQRPIRAERAGAKVRSFPVIQAMLQGPNSSSGQGPIVPAAPGGPEPPDETPTTRGAAPRSEPAEPAKLPAVKPGVRGLPPLKPKADGLLPAPGADPFAPEEPKEEAPPAKKPAAAPKAPRVPPEKSPPPLSKPADPLGDLPAPEYGGSCGAYCEECPPWYGRERVRDWLWGVCYEGWIGQGVTFNSLSPRNHSNYPVAFNDYSNDYQLNQLYATLVREVDSSGCAWDVGGRVDLLYGTDWVFVASRGLEADRGFSPKWNAERYGLAMPQCYMEVYAPVLTGVSLKLGHFYSILGCESAMAPENFFYSHSYLRQYAEPFTHTGLLASTRVGGFTLQAGMTRGWDNWEDNNNDLGVLAGLSWTSPGGATTVAFAIHSGREQDEPPGNDANRTAYSLVWQQRLSPRLQYVLQHDWGFDDGAAPAGLGGAGWFGLNQYFLYTVNECWKAGLRFEWFRDDEGARIAARPVRGADYYEASLGVNWTPSQRVILRPEVRWDWVQAPGYTPFADNTRSSQFLFACDLILRF